MKTLTVLFLVISLTSCGAGYRGQCRNRINKNYDYFVGRERHFQNRQSVIDSLNQQRELRLAKYK